MICCEMSPMVSVAASQSPTPSYRACYILAFRQVSQDSTDALAYCLSGVSVTESQHDGSQRAVADRYRTWNMLPVQQATAGTRALRVLGFVLASLSDSS